MHWPPTLLWTGSPGLAAYPGLRDFSKFMSSTFKSFLSNVSTSLSSHILKKCLKKCLKVLPVSTQLPQPPNLLISPKDPPAGLCCPLCTSLRMHLRSRLHGDERHGSLRNHAPPLARKVARWGGGLLAQEPAPQDRDLIRALKWALFVAFVDHFLGLLQNPK